MDFFLCSTLPTLPPMTLPLFSPAPLPPAPLVNPRPRGRAEGTGRAQTFQGGDFLKVVECFQIPYHHPEMGSKKCGSAIERKREEERGKEVGLGSAQEEKGRRWRGERWGKNGRDGERGRKKIKGRARRGRGKGRQELKGRVEGEERRREEMRRKA